MMVTRLCCTKDIMEQKIPATQYAVELTGPDELRVNSHKEVYRPGSFGILAKVEAVGLCFSDLKLLKQFSGHVRKSEIISGIDKSVLEAIPSYVPNGKPTVPGHEACCVVASVGEKVKHHYVGQRVLVQPDWRWLKTANSNAAFGYNFEGALQQYVLFDERAVMEPQSGESFLIGVDAELNASAVALVEPWACVENSYITRQRNYIMPAAKLLVAADDGYEICGLKESFSGQGGPSLIYVFCAEKSQYDEIKQLGIETRQISNLGDIPNEGFDDIVYFGSRKDVIEILNDKLAANGIINIVLAGNKISGQVSVGIGRIHYGNTRWIGTTGKNPVQSYKNIPRTGEIRTGERINIVGAAGPMGQMHTIRLASLSKENISITATDVDSARLAVLENKTRKIAKENSVDLKFVNSQNCPPPDLFSYFAIMAPIPALVVQSIENSMAGALINIFAGIPINVRHEIDLNLYIEKRLFMFGTSGSTLEDMKTVLRKVVAHQLDTNLSVDAVSGMAGAVDGIRAVENRSITGKIIVYPQLVKMPLIPLADMHKYYPAVANKLIAGLWTKDAERELLTMGHLI
ncbi:MAG: alcohol dehydrogenase catalytic domain-containing protein [Phycisphaerae bacterium]|nr:alcohol dehydrogenase catalytic domain-containing protein [Phycisphaerae bacterium]